MKQLMWITTKAREHLFSELWASAHIASSFCDAAQIPDLISFVASASEIEQLRFFVVDLSASYSAEQLLGAAKVLAARSSAVPIFITSPDNAATAGRLAGAGMRNFVHDYPARNAEMRICLSGNAGLEERAAYLQRGLAAQAVSIVRPLHIPQQLTVCCAVAGVSPCVGTTTQALLLCRYLSMLGFKPLLIDSTQRLYSLLARTYPQHPITQNQGYCTRNGLCLATHGLSHIPLSCEFNAYVYDQGVLIGEEKLSAFQITDLRLLVSSLQLPHQQSYQSLRETLQKRSIGFSACCTPLQASAESTQLAPWHPDLLADGDTTHLARLLLPRLREICNE